MRLPLSKPYRAFPELDPFTDLECQVFVAESNRRHRWSGRVVGVAMSLCIAIALGIAISLVNNIGQQHVLDTTGRPLPVWRATAAIAVPLIAGCAVALLIRDRWLLTVLRRRINRARCHNCRYSLLGLAIERGDFGDRVTCPECGARTSLKSAGLTAEDLLSPPTTASA
ncbi:MAG: hypothetical protein AAF138_00340 [Planctomycetota bacterium]